MKNVQVKLTLPENLYNLLKTEAQQNGLALSPYIRFLLLNQKSEKVKESPASKNTTKKSKTVAQQLKRIEDIF